MAQVAQSPQVLAARGQPLREHIVAVMSFDRVPHAAASLVAVVAIVSPPIVQPGRWTGHGAARNLLAIARGRTQRRLPQTRSEEHTSELQSLMRISYSVFCLTKRRPTPAWTTTT